MRVAALLLNVLLFLFTVMVCLTDGMPTTPWYLVFTWFMLLLPPVTAWALWHQTWRTGLHDRVRKTVGGLNGVLIALVVAAVIDQYPHPDEPGLYTFILLTVVTPLLSAWVLLRSRPTDTAGA